MDQKPDQNPETQGTNPSSPSSLPDASLQPEASPVAAEPTPANIDPIASTATSEVIPSADTQPTPNPTVDSVESSHPTSSLATSTETSQPSPNSPSSNPDSSQPAINSPSDSAEGGQPIPAQTPAANTPAPAHPAKQKRHHSKSKRHSAAPVNYVRRPILLVIIMIFLILVILAGAGLAAWYFLCYNRPENVALDAIDNFLHERSVVVNGTIRTKLENNLITLDLNSDTYDLTGSSKATLSISSLDANGSVIYDQPYQVEIGSVLMSDGVLYLRFDELSNALDQYFEDHGIAPDFDLFTSLVYQSAKVIDGQWWQISIPDIINLYADSPAQAQPAKELYACVVNTFDRDVKGELAAIYREHQFINISRNADPSSYSKAVADGFNNLYEVTLDYDKMADFVNSLPSSGIATSIYNCVNHYYESAGSSQRVSAADSQSVSAESLKEEFSDQQKLELEITNFSHQLVGINATYGEDGLISLTFQYQPVSVTPPHRYHRFSELLEELGETFLNSAEDIYDGLHYNPDADEWEIIENDLFINDEIETT